MISLPQFQSVSRVNVCIFHSFIHSIIATTSLCNGICLSICLILSTVGGLHGPQYPHNAFGVLFTSSLLLSQRFIKSDQF